MQRGIAAVTDREARWTACLGGDEARAFRQALATLSRAFGREHIR